MDIERLREYFQTWFEHNRPLTQTMLNDLLALIDEKIAEQSVTDEPCDECRASTDALYAFRRANGEYAIAKQASNCPSCGRKLKDGE